MLNKKIPNQSGMTTKYLDERDPGARTCPHGKSYGAASMSTLIDIQMQN